MEGIAAPITIPPHFAKQDWYYSRALTVTIIAAVIIIVTGTVQVIAQCLVLYKV